MGIINVSPNSFYHPHSTLNAALNTAKKMVADGALILDVGGEATNPFVDIETESPSIQQEIDRVVPVVEAIKQRFDVLVSVDTSRSKVMREAVESGADIINDQRALRVGDAMETVATLRVPVCLMHLFQPLRKPDSCDPATLLNRIKQDLENSIIQCEKKGITLNRIIIDPGFGGGNYGKSAAENYYLLAHLRHFVDMGFPVLTGWSRKSMIGDTLEAPPEERLFGSITADAFAIFNGATIIRTHDVRPVCDAIKVVRQVKKYSGTFSSEIAKMELS